MRLGRRLAAGLVATLIVTVAFASGARHVSAQPALPYLAYGVGLQRGQLVEALVGGTAVSRAVADARGRWKMLIEPGPAVTDGDTIAFTVDGVATGRTAVFLSGRFAAPPGIALAPGAPSTTPVAGAAATPRPTATARPAASPRPLAPLKPKAACTKDGRPVTCSSFAPRAPRR